jgi:hypothetical protein
MITLKKTIPLILLLITINAHALSMNSPNNIQRNNQDNIKNNNSSSKDWMRTKTGTVLVFDKQRKIMIVNGKVFSLATNFKNYDGTPKKGSSIKFNLNPDKKVTELWVVKQ